MATILKTLSTGEVDIPIGPLVVGTATAGPFMPGGTTSLGALVEANQPNANTNYNALQSYLYVSNGLVTPQHANFAVQGQVEVANSSNTVNNATAVVGSVEVSGAGTTAYATGVTAAVFVNGTGNITNARGFAVDGPDIISGVGTAIANVYQIITDDCDFGTTRYNCYLGGCVQGATQPTACYGLWIDPVSGASTANYAIYTNQGPVRFGDATTINNGASDNQLTLDNTGQQYTVLYLNNNGTKKASFSWDQTNSLARLGVPAASSTLKIAPNGADRWTFDGAGNLLADTSNGGYVAFRPGTASTTAKATGTLFESGNASTTSTTTATLSGGSNGGTYTLKANTLANNGDTLRISYVGYVSATTGTLTLAIGSATIINAVSLSSNGSFAITVWVTRRDSTHIDWTYEGAHFNSSTVTDLNRSNNVSLDLTVDETINFRGAATSGTLTAQLCQVLVEAA